MRTLLSEECLRLLKYVLLIKNGSASNGHLETASFVKIAIFLTLGTFTACY